MSTLTQAIGLSEVKIEYSRPGMKGRTIFGGLVPYNEIWRTGANGSTDITFSDDAMVNGHGLKAGKYALYTIPGEKEWTILFYKNADHWGTPGEDYDEAQVAAKFVVESESMPFKVETFTIGVNNIKADMADVLLYWESTFVSFSVTFETEKMVMASIDKTMKGPSAGDYYRAARYYFDSEKDLNVAHKWITRATEMRDDAFWMFRIKSQIEAKMGDYDKAIQTAKKSILLAEKAGNTQYVKFNEEAIAEWSMK